MSLIREKVKIMFVLWAKGNEKGVRRAAKEGGEGRGEGRRRRKRRGGEGRGEERLGTE